MLTIAALAFHEVLRKKVLVFAIILTAAFLALYGVALHYVGLDLNRFNRTPLAAQMATTQLFSAGLYLGSFIVSFLAIFSAVGTISAEIENGIIQAIVTKPIRRRDIVLGKFLGYAAMMAVYAALFYLGLTGLVRWQLGTPLAQGFLPAMLLFMLQPLILLSVTILGTTALTTLGNGILVIMLYALSIIGGMIEQVGVILKNDVLTNSGIVSSLVMPADALYRRIVSMLIPATGNPLAAVQQMGPFGSMSPPSNAMLVYTFLYIAVALLWAVRVFNRRDI